MHINSRWIGITLGTAMVLSPINSYASPAASAEVHLALNAGGNAVHVSGTFPGERFLQAVVYADLAPEVPLVFVRRQSLFVDVHGRIDTTISVAPAYFVGSRLTVVIETLENAPLGRASIALSPPSN
jgi:hypothetical protein